jgi:hypothetical protein
MGCFESRQEGKPGTLRFLKKEEYQVEPCSTVAIDCSVDSFDGKIKSADIYAKQRIPKAQYLNLN